MADTTTFYPLLHAMLRANSDPAEIQRATEVMQWVEARTKAIGEVMHADELRLINLTFAHWRDFKTAASRSNLEEMVRKEDHPEGPLALLTGYDQYLAAGQLKPIDAGDVPLRFRDRIEDWSKSTFIDLMKQAKMIAESGLDIDKKTTLKGVDDARNHVLLKLHSNVFGDMATVRGGSVEILADDVVRLYEKNKKERLEGKLTIPTGISVIDSAVGGLDRKTLNLILGYTGQRKSAVARTIAYNAAVAGFRVLFLPLEFTLDEEKQIFAMLHSRHPAFYGTEEMTITNLLAGNLSDAHEEFLKKILVPNFRTEVKNLVILEVQDKTWPGMQSVIDSEDAKAPLDLVVMDYVTLLDVSEARDTTFAMNQNIKQLKHKCLHHAGGRGLTFLSPVSGNRKGYADAQANDGLWDSTAIWMYSEMEKSADNILSTFMPPELAAQNKLKLGFPKTRRRGPVQPQEVDIDPGGGIVGVAPKDEKKETVGPPKKDHDIAAVANSRP